MSFSILEVSALEFLAFKAKIYQLNLLFYQLNSYC